MSIQFVGILQVLILIALANGAPVFAKKVLGPLWAWPVDGGRVLRDGQPLFGHSKTIRGIVLAVLFFAVLPHIFDR